MVSPQPQGILNRVAAPNTIFRGLPRPAQSFQGGTVMDLLNSLGVDEDITDVLPGLDTPLPEVAPVSATELPTTYIPVLPDPDAPLQHNPEVGVE